MEIEVSGHIAHIDPEDYKVFAAHAPWSICKSTSSDHIKYLAKKVDGKRVFLHRLLLSPSRGQVVDHVSGDGLDNRRCNLRLCEQMRNLQNRKIARHNKSGFKGVYLDSRRDSSRKPWRAEISANRQRINLGAYATPEDAAKVYDLAAVIYHREFARTNKSMGLLA